jgi:hypothetical protein
MTVSGSNVVNPTISGGLPVYTGDNTSGIYIWGAQLEALPYATSYIPTVASTVTRVADVVSKTGLSSYINSSEGVLFVEMATNSKRAGNEGIYISDGTTNNEIAILYYGSLNRIDVAYIVGGSLVYYKLFTGYTITNFNKIALKWKNNDFATFINGVKLQPQLSGSVMSANTLNKISASRLTVNSSIKLKNKKIYTTALSDAQLIALTQ